MKTNQYELGDMMRAKYASNWQNQPLDTAKKFISKSVLLP